VIASRPIDQRLAVDPYCTLDVVLRPTGLFPLDLIDRIENQLAAAAPSYGTRLLSWRKENALRRLCVCLPEGARFSPDFVTVLMQRVAVFADQDLARAASRAGELGVIRPGARVTGSWPQSGERAWQILATQADPEAVVFASRSLEQRWTDEVLGYREIERP